MALTFHIPAQAAPGDTVRVSVANDGSQISGALSPTSVSSDGRYVTFVTTAAAVPEDTNGLMDIYVRDTQAGTTTLASVATDSSLTNADGTDAGVISADGRFVAFKSSATSLTAEHTPGVFLRDLVNHTTVIVSVNNSGTPTANLAFFPSISADGRYVAFASWARQNLTGNCGSIFDNNSNVYLRDTVNNITTCVSVDSSGQQIGGGNQAISGDGRYVFFGSGFQLYARDTLTNTTAMMSVDSNGVPGNSGQAVDTPSASYDGRFVVFNSDANNLIINDTNGWKDVFVHDRDTDTDGIFDEPGAISTIRVSVASGGGQIGAYSLYPPSISADGHFVAFTVSSSDLINPSPFGASYVFVHDLGLNTTMMVSVTSNGMPADQSSMSPAISSDGRFVSFMSNAGNLADDDTNGVSDIFLHDLSAPSNSAPTDISLSNTGVNENQPEGTVIGLLNTIDTDNTDTHTYSFCGATDDLSFQISGANLRTNAVFDFETKNSYSICVRTDDGNGGTFDKNITITVIDVDEVHPTVVSITHPAVPQNASNFNYTVTFSESVTGVDASDFYLTVNGLVGTHINSVSGADAIYTISVNTGNGDGVIRLDVHDNDTITDLAGNPLGGTGTGNGDFTTGMSQSLKRTVTIFSTANGDGWVLEYSADTNRGGTINSTESTVRIGDDSNKKQYRSILSFKTSPLPDTAIITSVALKLTRKGAMDSNLFSSFHGLMIDVKKGTFFLDGLEARDFQATADLTVGPYFPVPSGAVYTLKMPTSVFPYINKLSIPKDATQFRLRFRLTDNNNPFANFISFSSSDIILNPANKPTLIITYVMP